MRPTMESIAETGLRLHRPLVPPIGFTHKKCEGNISKKLIHLLRFL